MSKTDKYLDDLSKTVIKNAPAEQPSFDFTNSVMDQISELKTSSITYKPLISKKGWTLLILFVVAIIALSIFTNDSTEGKRLFGNFDVSAQTNNLLGNISNIQMSNTLVYALTFFGLMFIVQISVLKNHFNKQFH